MHVVKWWVDASFAAHPNMTSDTGGMMTLGKRQKINTKSTTEIKLVRVDDVMPQILSTRRFLAAQGDSTEESVIYDNQSAMPMGKNRKRIMWKTHLTQYIFCPRSHGGKGR